MTSRASNLRPFVLWIGMLSTGLVTPPPSIAAGERSAPLRDQAYFFTVPIPDGWRVEQATSADSFWRASASDPSGGLFVAVYAIQNATQISLEKFAALDHKLFENLGEEASNRLVRDYWIRLKAVEKTYGRNAKGLYALAHFRASGAFGYVVVLFSEEDDFSSGRIVVDGFKSEVPRIENVKLALSRPFQWFGGIPAMLLAFGALYLLGKTGRMVRSGVEQRKALGRAQADLATKGQAVNYEACRRISRQAARLVWGPIVAWAAVYGVLAVILPAKIFMVSLIGLIVPAMGYFGLYFGPSVDV